MNPLTDQLLKRLWKGDQSFGTIAARLKTECQSLSPAEAAVIGKDLIRRRAALYTKDFALAAFLASDGEAGNDGFSDFTDCVAILPEDRYLRITQNPDDLIDDPVSWEFDEFYFVSAVSKVFDRAILDDQADGGLLYYLVSDDKGVDWDEVASGTEADARQRLPRLYLKFGHLLKRPTESVRKHVTDGGRPAFLNPECEQTGTGQPATRPVDKPEGDDKPQPEAEGRDR
jgi:hypothetical protein